MELSIKLDQHCGTVYHYVSHDYQVQRFLEGAESLLWKTILKGIPEGSILGPLLLNIFKNKLHKLTESTTTSTYADETQIFYAGNDVVINCDLQRVDQWLDKNLKGILAKR